MSWQRMARVRILLVDDFALFRSYVRRILEKHLEWQVIGEVGDGDTALRMATELRPDLILLDIGLPRVNGIEVAQQLASSIPSCRIVFVTSNCALDVVQKAFDLGAMAYAVKWNGDRDLLLSVAAAIEGKRFISERISGLRM